MKRAILYITLAAILLLSPLILVISSPRVMAAAPTVTSCTPPTGNRGETGKSVVIAGANFTGSTRVNFGSEDWDFGTAGEYTYDAGKVSVSGGAASLTAPCYAHWSLNETTGTNVPDTSGFGRNGTTVNNPSWVAGKLNNCLRFNGSSQYVTFGNIADWESTDRFSIAGWFKTSNPNGMLMSKMVQLGTYRGWVVFNNAAGGVAVIISNDVSANLYLDKETTVGGLNNGAWHQYVVTYNGSRLASGVTIYVDGAPAACSVLRDTLGTGTIKNAIACEMAARNEALFYIGDMDETVLYTRELSAGDVTTLWNGGAGTESVGSYATDDPPIVGNNTLSFAQNLTSFVATATTPSGTEIRYQVSVNNGSTYRYWDGAIWTTSDLTYAQSSTASDINAHISTLGSSGTFKVRAMLHSTGASTPILDNIAVGSGITVNSFVVDNSAQITANVTIAWDAPLGARDVIIKNADGEGVGSSKFTINAPLPTVIGILPTGRNQGETSVSEVITGTGFIGATVVAFSGTGITVDSFLVDNSTQITATITVSGGAPIGFRDVSVTTPGGTGTGTGIFEVRSLVPIVTILAPDNGNRGEAAKSEVITGQYFTGATVVAFSGTGITVNSFVVDLDTQITANITIAWDATLGLRDVSVTTPVGTGTGLNKYTVNAPTPTVTGVAPANGDRGETSKTVTLTGTGFIGATVVAFSGTGIIVNSFLVDNSTQITSNITIAWDATLSVRNVSVTTPGGTGTKNTAFTVNAPLPTVTGATPIYGTRGDVGKTVVIAGTGFIGATVVAFSATGITVNSFVVDNGLQITANIDISMVASLGAGDIVVTAPGGVGTGIGTFTVYAVATTVSVVSPSEGDRGETYSVSLTGTGFTGATVVSFGDGTDVSSYTVDSDTHITAILDITAGATLGNRTVSVTAPGGTGVKAEGFSINAPSGPFDPTGLIICAVCLCLTGGGWYFRNVPILMIAGLAWMGLGIFELTGVTQEGDIGHILGAIGALMAFVVFMKALVLWIGGKPEKVSEEEHYRRQLRRIAPANPMLPSTRAPSSPSAPAAPKKPGRKEYHRWRREQRGE